MANELFYCKSKNISKNGGPSWTVCDFRRMRERVEVFLKWSMTSKDRFQDWQLGEQWEQQYFYSKG